MPSDASSSFFSRTVFNSLPGRFGRAALQNVKNAAFMPLYLSPWGDVCAIVASLPSLLSEPSLRLKLLTQLARGSAECPQARYRALPACHSLGSRGSSARYHSKERGLVHIRSGRIIRGRKYASDRTRASFPRETSTPSSTAPALFRARGPSGRSAHT